MPENYLHLRTALFILFYLSTGESKGHQISMQGRIYFLHSVRVCLRQKKKKGNRILSSRPHSHRSFKKDKGPVRRIGLDVIIWHDNGVPVRLERCRQSGTMYKAIGVFSQLCPVFRPTHSPNPGQGQHPAWGLIARGAKPSRKCSVGQGHEY